MARGDDPAQNTVSRDDRRGFESPEATVPIIALKGPMSG
jgi:hypothetical protein